MRKMNWQDILIVFPFFLFQIGYFTWVSWQKPNWINTDAVPYMRLAQYYASGQVDLMISGYWGPLLSWIIAPFLAFVEEPLSAGHLAMGISASLYLLGSWAIFRIMGIGLSAMLVALGIVILFSISWSVQGVTPDILVGGLLCLATSRILREEWCDKTAVQISAGLLFGVAYLAKAVALPFSCILIMAVGVLWVVCQQARPMRVLRSLAMTFLGLFLIAGPWILLLSLKYERPVFSTSAEINHSMVGPSQGSGKHPTFRLFHIPEQGRVTSWEDPSPETYTHWSPLESPKNIFHQLRVMVKNAQAALFALKVYDWLGIGVISVIFGFCFHVPWRENLRMHRWRWSAVFVGCLVAIYLPVYGGDMRYYLAAYPFLLGGSLGFVGYLARDPSNQTKFLHILAIGFVAFSFMFPLSLIPSPNEKPGYQAAKLLRDKLQTIHISGPIASACESKDIAYYTAFLMEMPYHGNFREAQTVEDVQTSAAKIIIVERGTVVDENLTKDKNFIRLDENLFDSLERDDIQNATVYINTKI